MGRNIIIPSELAHLKLDDRGYPIPFFVTPTTGKPEFRYLQPERVLMIAEKGLCHICGKKLPKDSCFFITGPVGLTNRVSTDAGMHRVCAEFSLRACPHLFFQKADRRQNDELGKKINSDPHSPILRDKPDVVLLVKASKYKVKIIEKRFFIFYNPVSHETYSYEDGILKKQ